MEKKTIPLDYANSLIYEVEKAFWDERGRGARFRMTTVGQSYFIEKCRPLLKSKDIEENLAALTALLKEEGIAADIHFSREERLLKVQVHGCLHHTVEEQLVKNGIEPFTCVPANLIVLALEETLDRPVELAEVKIEAGVCNLLLVLFDQRPSLD